MLAIKSPTLVLNQEICKKNIRAMVSKSRNHNVIFRPHFKTHQSAAVAEWFRDESITAITVSSVAMAAYFADHGWKDITIAFPANLREAEEINQLAARISLNLLIESEETANYFAEHLTLACGFYIKIDTGYHRTGVDPTNLTLLDIILNEANASKLRFKGFLTHSGQTYHARDRQELEHISSSAADKLLRLKKHYLQQFPDLRLSIGDTPSCSQVPIPAGTDEIRPGNFVFYDVMQFSLGSCTLQDIAVALICPVAAVHHNRMEAVIYGGAVHLSKESTTLPPDPKPVFGLAVRWNGLNWDTGELLGKVSGLSQEHGIISLTQAGCNLKPGDLVAILPVHSCLTAHLMRRYYTPDGSVIETMNS